MPESPTPSQIDFAAQVDQLASLVQLPIEPDFHPGVTANLERIHAIAQLVLDFPLPEDLEVAPTFEP